jgi:hypothetical protein
MSNDMYGNWCCPGSCQYETPANLSAPVVNNLLAFGAFTPQQKIQFSAQMTKQQNMRQMAMSMGQPKKFIPPSVSGSQIGVL